MPSEQRAGLDSSIPPPKPIPAVQHFNDFARLDQNAPKNDLASPRKEDELDPVRVLVKRPLKLSELERFAIEAALQRTGGNVTRAMRQLGIGRTTLAVALAALSKGGHLRVGMEDTLSLSRGVKVSHNAELVERAAQLATLAQRPPMSPDDARELLQVKQR